MNHWLDNTWGHLRFGESLLAGGVESLSQGWIASTEMIGKLWDGARSGGKPRIARFKSLP